MSFSFIVIGCGSATPIGHRLSSAFILKHNRSVFLIDCGEGSQMYLKENHVHLQRINQIFISHLHGDHFFGLIGLLSSMHLFGRNIPLTIYAPRELEAIIKLQLKAGATVLSYPLFFRQTQNEEKELLYEDKEVEVYSFPLNHSIPTTGFLFKEKIKPNYPIFVPKSFAYCSDTAYSEAIIPYIKGVDLLYHESTFMESDIQIAESRQHSTARQAAKIAKMANVKRLLIGHYSARYSDVQCFLEEAKLEFQNVLMAFEGLCINI